MRTFFPQLFITTIPWRKLSASPLLRRAVPDHTVVGLPTLSPTMTAGTISSWTVKEGDEVAAGDVFCEIETDKATVDFECQNDCESNAAAAPPG